MVFPDAPSNSSNTVPRQCLIAEEWVTYKDKNDLVLFLVMLFFHTRSLVLSALTLQFDKFQFNEFCLDWKRDFYIFSH